MIVRVLFFISLLLTSVWAPAQTLVGRVVLYEDDSPLFGVAVSNIHTGQRTISDSKGNFQLPAKGEQLLEFQLDGYRVRRIRIPQAMPTFFVVQMQRVLPKYVVSSGATGDYHKDSLRYGTLYENYLAKPKFTALDAIQHPFSALSKTNRMIWGFQDNYKWFEQLKFVDYAFSDNILRQLTGLPADSTEAYRRRFALPYEVVRGMKSYDLFTYIKQTVIYYRTGRDPRFAPIRNSN